MFPYAHMTGTFATPRPTAQQPELPLGDDDRTGLRFLYSNPSDLVHTGSIAGRVIPANPLSLPASPPGVSGIFLAQVVAVDSAREPWAAGVARIPGQPSLMAAIRLKGFLEDTVTRSTPNLWMEQSIRHKYRRPCRTCVATPRAIWDGHHNSAAWFPRRARSLQFESGPGLEPWDSQPSKLTDQAG
jgi:hypothetical protein